MFILINYYTEVTEWKARRRTATARCSGGALAEGVIACIRVHVSPLFEESVFGDQLVIVLQSVLGQGKVNLSGSYLRTLMPANDQQLLTRQVGREGSSLPGLVCNSSSAFGPRDNEESGASKPTLDFAEGLRLRGFERGQHHEELARRQTS